MDRLLYLSRSHIQCVVAINQVCLLYNMFDFVDYIITEIMMQWSIYILIFLNVFLQFFTCVPIKLISAQPLEGS